ncbi:MAG: transposase [Erysipelotrichaceae bacterium]|nr:transposase [Erysipelotrichaceae bacterium]
MTTITQNKRYLPHDLNTRYYAVRLYRQVKDLNHVIRRYHISKASLMRWNKLFDGTKQSLTSRSHRPLSPHPNSHTPTEIKWITDYHRRNPHLSVIELYGRLRKDKGYSRHPLSLYRVFARLGFTDAPVEKRESYKPKPYITPASPGVKWQMDVKYVPSSCYSGKDGQKFFQYTVIDEATRERFIYPYTEQSSYSTVDFTKRAIKYFGYRPLIIQTDNGVEFTHTTKTDRVHPMDILCNQLGITHKLIRPRTPRHNGKVERSHRSDQQRFYNFLSFYSYQDLLVQMKRYLYRSNNIPMAVLDWMSPLEKRRSLLG